MLAALSLGACAGSPQKPASETEIVQVKLDSRFQPLEKAQVDDALVASDLRVGVDGDLLRYKASYSIQPGDILARRDSAISPTRFGGQRFDQNLHLQLPELAGSPLSVGLATEFGDNWQVSGYSQFQREHAKLDWSPGPATVAVQWAGSGLPLDAAAALSCSLQSTLSLPTHEGSDHSESVRFSAGDCSVAADDTLFSGFDTQAWGVGYVWSRPGGQSEAEISIIEPAWEPLDGVQMVEPGYKLGLSHRRDFGPLSARAILSFRQSPLWANAAASSDIDSLYGADASWATSTSLTWDMPVASLSANWATGIDKLWFTPEMGAQSDRFGLALNLSRWFGAFVNGSAPKLAMNWQWSEVRLPGDEISGNNSLSLDMALMF